MDNSGPKFVPALLGEKITIRPIGGGQPMTGILKGYNSYELLVEVSGSLHIVYKHAIHSIQVMDVAKFNTKLSEK
jgi:sRNA-binding regulator protein Hfq